MHHRGKRKSEPDNREDQAMFLPEPPHPRKLHGDFPTRRPETYEGARVGRRVKSDCSKGSWLVFDGMYWHGAELPKPVVVEFPDSNKRRRRV